MSALDRWISCSSRGKLFTGSRYFWQVSVNTPRTPRNHHFARPGHDVSAHSSAHDDAAAAVTSRLLRPAPVSLRHLDMSYLGHCFSFSKDNRSFVVVLSPRRGKTLSMLCWCARESISVIASITRTT